MERRWDCLYGIMHHGYRLRHRCKYQYCRCPAINNEISMLAVCICNIDNQCGNYVPVGKWQRLKEIFWGDIIHRIKCPDCLKKKDGD